MPQGANAEFVDPQGNSLPKPDRASAEQRHFLRSSGPPILPVGSIPLRIGRDALYLGFSAPGSGQQFQRSQNADDACRLDPQSAVDVDPKLSDLRPDSGNVCLGRNIRADAFYGSGDDCLGQRLTCPGRLQLLDGLMRIERLCLAPSLNAISTAPHERRQSAPPMGLSRFDCGGRSDSDPAAVPDCNPASRVSRRAS